MKPANPGIPQRLVRRAAAAGRGLLAVLAAAGFAQAMAANELANSPLFTASSTAVKPNLMFILDDSGSMQWDFMPDAAEVLNRTHYGRTSAQCNGLAYDPDQTYPVPYTVNSSSFAVEPVALPSVSAWTNADPALQTTDQLAVRSFSAGNGVAVGRSVSVTLNGTSNQLYFADPADTVTVYKNSTNYFVAQLTNANGVNNNNRVLTMTIVFVAGNGISNGTSGLTIGKGEPVTGEYYVYNGVKSGSTFTKQPRLAWYNQNGTVNTTGTFYTQCTTLTSTSTTVFSKVRVSDLDADKKQNYANWAAFYRTRISAMKNASTVAFRDIGERYRVGYSAISQPRASVTSDQFLHVDVFKGQQKKDFYDRLAAAAPGDGGTPLRGALAKAGQYFADKALGQDKDPIQFSCQRNFAILSTDGYWNAGGGSATETARDSSGRISGTDRGYGPHQLDRSSLVGNVDDALPRPMADGNTLKVTTTERWSTITQGRVDKRRGFFNVQTNTETSTATGKLYDETITEITRVSSSTCNNNRWRKRTTVSTRTVNGVRERGKTIEVRTPMLTTTTVDRTQQVDHVRTTVVNNGALVSTNQQDTTVTPVNESVIRETTVQDGAVQRIETPFDNPTEVPGPWDVDTTTTSGCSSFSNSTTRTTNPSPAKLPSSLTNFGALVTSPVVNSTLNRTVTPAEVWLTTPAPTVNDTEKLVTEVFDSDGGQENTLADVAAYYYETDLRDASQNNCRNDEGKDVCENNVPANALKDPYKSFGDPSRKQHMTTFTLGLGVSGSLKFDQNYINLRSGDFHEIVNLGRNWPNTTSGQNTTVDDLWHAAVNGHGQYFSAGNPAALTSGLNTALAAIDTVLGSASAASTSSLQPVAGDNDIFVAQFTTKDWTGDVLAFQIDPNTGLIPKTTTWSAQKQLEEKDYTTRTIYYRKPGETTLRAFTFDNLNADGLGANFANFCGLSGAGTAFPTQCANLQDKTEANKGVNLVNYLRGDQTMAFYRKRDKRLGDVINASPLFIGKPGFKYTEHDYETYASTKASRKAVVLAAANDGMLHAFDRATGNELWAYIPSHVIPNLHKLADEGFVNNHSYFVDGSPQVGDIWVGDATTGSWKTIVVGGLNKGGRGYYALDLTNPAKPEVLWEFTHDNLGYSFGNPIITKRVGTDASGKKKEQWVVVFASGYENVNPGDGNGRLFVLDANTGVQVIEGGIPTLDASGNAVGSTSAPSGLAHINDWVESEADNTALRFYGGDELGNLWRFDLDGNVEPVGKALLLAQLRKDNAAQPITTRPVLAAVNYNGTDYPVVFVGTGSYQRLEDNKDTKVQSVYAIKDPLTNSPYGDIRAGGRLVTQTITSGVDAKAGTATRTSTKNPVDWGTKAGWMVDFPVGGERVAVHPVLALDTIFIGSNLPKDEDCSVGGDSFLYQFNINSGQSTATYVGNVLVQGLTVVQLTTGSNAGALDTIITRSDGTLQTEPGTPPVVTGVLKRTSWREIVD